MRLVTYLQNGVAQIGAVVDERVIDLSEIAPDMLSFIELGDSGLAQARAAVALAKESSPLASVRLLAPIPTPRRNVMCLGLNYAEHAAESAAAGGTQPDLPDFPIVFTKATTAANGPFDAIPYDASVSDKLDWEVELGVVIGRLGANISLDQAMDHVFGYMVVNDVSARDLQWRHKQFFKGKSLDGACPMGPWIVTADEIGDPHELSISCRVNGVVKQDGNTRHMIFNVPATIMHLSTGMTLLPGDIIATGTPSGVGFARTPPEFLKPGDVVECEVERIGAIKNTVAG
ncbi:MAG: fumarylacetoacetate hydrolase family protein [Chloroflexota bacterium]|jgi:2-keto-4-pentenoate hydratase/2-oxohepta-3-ene-1,7-dioic acid hydratase in catechol pathway